MLLLRESHAVALQWQRVWDAHPFLSQRPLSALLLCVCFLLNACSGSTGKPIETVVAHTPTPSPLSSGTILYQTDLMYRLAELQPTKGWKVQDDLLQSDLSKDQSLHILFHVPVPDYAIEIRLQIASEPRDGGGFHLDTDRNAEQDGYHADVLGLLGPGQHIYAIHPLSEVLLDPQEDEGIREEIYDFEPGANWHVYRIEVQGPRVLFRVDNFIVSRMISTRTRQLSHGPFVFQSTQVALKISSIRISVL